jgi:hypothetical protein
MNKKIFVVLFFVGLFLLGSNSISGVPQDSKNIVKEKLIKNTDVFKENNYEIQDFGFVSEGPINSLFVELESIDGSESTVELIQNCMDKKPPLIARFVPAYPIPVMGLDITIYFKRDVNRGLRKMYMTFSGEYVFNENGELIDVVNVTYYTSEIHRVQVTNLNGLFVYFKPRLIRGIIPRPKNLLWPARFMILGLADNVEYLK